MQKHLLLPFSNKDVSHGYMGGQTLLCEAGRGYINV